MALGSALVRPTVFASWNARTSEPIANLDAQLGRCPYLLGSSKTQRLTEAGEYRQSDCAESRLSDGLPAWCSSQNLSVATARPQRQLHHFTRSSGAPQNKRHRRLNADRFFRAGCSSPWRKRIGAGREDSICRPQPRTGAAAARHPVIPLASCGHLVDGGFRGINRGWSYPETVTGTWFRCAS